MVTYEEEVVSAFLESIGWGETIVRSGVPTPEGFEGYDDGYIQQRISSSLELGCVLCTFDLLLQIADAVCVSWPMSSDVNPRQPSLDPS